MAVSPKRRDFLSYNGITSIFYTGNGRVGRIVASAAAKHLTPVTLELGGKSPCIIDSAYYIGLAAKRIFWGKINNAGQICVCPDYALVPRDKQDELIAASQKHATDFFPEESLKSSSSGRIVNCLHHSRLRDLLDRTKGIIVLGGHVDYENGFEVTIVKDVQDGGCLMEGYSVLFFQPFVDNISEAIEFVNSRPHALVIYAFSDDPVIKQQILHNTTSGNIVSNDRFQQLAVDAIPFGGVMGESGYGRQILKHSFDTFSYTRSAVDVPREAEHFLGIRYPPCTEDKFKAITASVFLKVPDSVAP